MEKAKDIKGGGGSYAVVAMITVEQKRQKEGRFGPLCEIEDES